MITIKRPIEIRDITKQTEENCLYAVVKTRGEYIKYIENPSNNLIKVAIRFNGMNIRFVKKSFVTRDMCELAAIHNAPYNILPIKDENIEKISEAVYTLNKLNFRGTFNINGEKTSFHTMPLTTIVEDIPEYIEILATNGLIKEDSLNKMNKIIVKDSKIYNMSSIKIEDSIDLNTKFTIDHVYRNNNFNRFIATKFIEQDFTNITQINKNDIDKKLIDSTVVKIKRKLNESRINKVLNYLPNKLKNYFICSIISNCKANINECLSVYYSMFHDINTDILIEAINRYISNIDTSIFVKTIDDAWKYYKKVVNASIEIDGKFKLNDFVKKLFEPYWIYLDSEDFIKISNSASIVLDHISDNIMKQINVNTRLSIIDRYIMDIYNINISSIEVKINLNILTKDEVVWIWNKMSGFNNIVTYDIFRSFKLKYKERFKECGINVIV